MGRKTRRLKLIWSGSWLLVLELIRLFTAHRYLPVDAVIALLGLTMLVLGAVPWFWRSEPSWRDSSGHRGVYDDETPGRTWRALGNQRRRKSYVRH